jgi:hypothetical protein
MTIQSLFTTTSEPSAPSTPAPGITSQSRTSSTVTGTVIRTDLKPTSPAH